MLYIHVDMYSVFVQEETDGMPNGLGEFQGF